MTGTQDSPTRPRDLPRDLPRVLIARRVPAAVAERAVREFDAILAEHDLDADEALRRVAETGAVAMVTGPRVRLTAAHAAALPPTLRVVANTSVGYDHMDVAATKAAGVIVTNAPDVLTDCTADLAFMLILNACRRATEYAAVMREGWRKGYGMPDLLGLQVSGRTLGIVGMGRIGRAVARRARGFGMKVLYQNRNRLPAGLEEGAEYVPTLEALLPRSQVLSLHLPGGAAGTLMTRETFALLPPGAVFVNTARGSLVDEEALIEALQSGRLFAAGLDVFRKEPDFDTRLAALPNAFLTPHVASATVETRNAMGFRALDNVAAVLAGGAPIDPV
ncbi:D-glycerate dehydrogenase [Roseomonas sp. NAR14]|uniref:D-glycerate dehydrogenase n=1 Tax=Roseomonas acroporae TaxID=2937791 RepID=A0A9X1YD45_9PROT|nr:D-glycerate dehydrogenase [Roseomonas acroporae]MCK8787923.1 D-glycerate dehydrogenase [Roseomonas acroporae]